MKTVFVGLILAVAALSANAGDASRDVSRAAAPTEVLHQPLSEGPCPDGQLVEYYYSPITHMEEWRCVSL